MTTDLNTDFKLTTNPLELMTVYGAADYAANGAIVLMSGMVRQQSGGRPVSYLDYQAYEPMALMIFAQIATHSAEKFPEITRLVIHHRLGKLQVGEVSVLVAVGSPHREAAFNACSYAIAELKQNAPIWKKEYWLDGASSWVNLPYKQK